MKFLAKIHGAPGTPHIHEVIEVELTDLDIDEIAGKAVGHEMSGPLATLRQLACQLSELDDELYDDVMEPIYTIADAIVGRDIIRYWNAYSADTTCSCGVKPKIELISKKGG